MLRQVLLALACVAGPASAQQLPIAIACYQDSTDAKDIGAYMACFTEDAQIIEVSRTFSGQDAIQAWAEREVIPGGDTFRHREILEHSDGYAKNGGQLAQLGRPLFVLVERRRRDHQNVVAIRRLGESG